MRHINSAFFISNALMSVLNMILGNYLTSLMCFAVSMLSLSQSSIISREGE